MLGIDSIAELAAMDPGEMYDRLCAITGRKVDICQYDLFCCAVAQAKDPGLPDEQKEWPWWSRKRLSPVKEGLLLKKAPRRGKRYVLADILDSFAPASTHPEVHFGKPQGEEVW